MQHSLTKTTKLNDSEGNINRFSDLNLKPDLLRGILNAGFDKPLGLQSKSILSLLKRKDTVIQSHSSTGKTLAYLIATLELIDVDLHKCQTLVLAPGREVATQIQRLAESIREYLTVSTYACVGGIDLKEERKKLQEGVQIIIATPGRVYDYIKKGFLDIKYLKLFILDEADEMLGRGFREQIIEILKMIEDDVQIGIASATLPLGIMEFVKKYTQDPLILRYDRPDPYLTLGNVKHYYVAIDREELKLDTLLELCLKLENTLQFAIYCKTRQQVDIVTTKLKDNGYLISGIHGDMSLEDRELALRLYRTGKTRILAINDFTAGSPELSIASVIINYDIPSSKENYLYRVGMSQDYDLKRVAINLVTPIDHRNLQQIEQRLNIQINELPSDGRIFEW